MSCRWFITSWFHASLLIGMTTSAVPQAESKPVIHAQPAHQSPVRGEPDELVLLPGYGLSADDVVVYRRITTDLQAAATPVAVPKESTAELGIAAIVSTQHIPYSLTILLPETMESGATYALWVHSARGEWSNATLINDARPLWFTPAYVHASQQNAGLPRYLKVVGRNLQAAPGHTTQVRLNGPQLSTLTARINDAANRMDEYVADVLLPEKLSPGIYQVELSRDGRNWIKINNQSLEVRPDPNSINEFHLETARFGGCKADDGLDDAACLQRAIVAAKLTGGTVRVGAGQWDLIHAENLNLPASEGLNLPRNVSLSGAGANMTRLVRHAEWNKKALRPALTLLGDSQISGFTFSDQQRYTSNSQAVAFIQLGGTTDTTSPLPAISNIIITNNTFDRVMIALADSGAPIRKLHVTYNTFGAYHESIHLGGNRFRLDTQFIIEDAIFAYNHFYPGGWLDVPNRQGTLATELGAGHRVDFSYNTADGSATRFLNDSSDVRGWRAGFFWHLNGNQEKLLISANTLSCTGDKTGDGEAIAFDNNGNTFGVDVPTAVTAATSNTITIRGDLLKRQYQRAVSDVYYLGHWIQVGEGRGLGQARKITAIRSSGNDTILSISPEWDIIPVAGSTRISIGREFWQAYVLGNLVDHRQPLCQKSNRANPKGGVIALWAQLADSVVAGNQQFDTDGILIKTMHTTNDGACGDCYRGTFYNNFVDIHHNLIKGEYDWERDCSSSGILVSLAASPGTPPLTTSYGLNIRDNNIQHADAWQGGAIAITPSWYQGPAPHRWPLVEGVLMQHNTLSDMWSRESRSCSQGQSTESRTGIDLGSSALVWRSTLYANACHEVRTALNLKNAMHSKVLCKSGMVDACECIR